MGVVPAGAITPENNSEKSEMMSTETSAAARDPFDAAFALR
jgi:hypothetical protein